MTAAAPTPAPTPPAATIVDFMALIKAMQGAAATEVADTATAPSVTKELPPELRVDLDAFNAAKEMVKYAESQKDIAEERIRMALDGADIGTIDGKEVVRVNASHNSHLDSGIVKTAFPEAFEAAYKRTDYTYLTVKR
jgi:predicted phage-related endonuclease